MGLTMPNLAQLFIDLGCTAAFNLDGGQTAGMVFAGEYVNKPYKGGRTIGDFIGIRPTLAKGNS